jgi:hypothetical protein
MMKDRLDPTLLKNTYSFEAYFQLVSELVKQNKTTGPSQSELNAHYTKLNFQRLKRIVKTLEISDELSGTIQNVQSEMLWVVIVEAWCGDVPQNLPYLNAISDACGKFQLKVVLRDDNPEIMDQFLTDGARSIPKLICLDPETYEVIGTWGPRPEGAGDLVKSLLKDPQITKDMRNEAVQRWYLQNKGMQLQSELNQLIKEWDLCLSEKKFTGVDRG